MFEVGCDYNITMLEYGQNYEGNWAHYESSRVFEVAAVEGNLVKLLGPDFSDSRFADFLPEQDDGKPREEIILNTSGMFFVKATKVHDT